MTPRLSRVWLLVALTSSCFTSFAQTPAPAPLEPPSPPPATARPAAPSTGEESIGTPSFSDMPLELVMPLIEQWTGRVVLRPQALPQSNISLVAKQPMTKAEAMRALETLLNLNGIALVRMGDKFIKVVALQNARGESPQMIEGSSLDLPPSGQVVSKLFQLQFLRTAEIGQMLGGLSLGNVSQPVIFDKNNSVLITDTLSNIQRIEMLLAKLDQPMTANLTPKFYNIKFAKASELVNKLRSMLQQQPQIGTSTNYTPDDRTNQVILISDPRLQSFFDELISKLDVKSDPNTRNEVLYLKHADSTKVAPILNQIVSGQSKAAQTSGSVQPGMIVQPNQPPPAPNQPAAPSAPVNIPSSIAGLGDVGSTQFSSLVNIIADERSNALVVNGTLDDIRLIKELVDQIDIVLAQVRIEVVIAEVTLSDAASSGIGELGLDVAGNKLIGFKGSTSGLSVGASANSSPYAQLHGTLLTDTFAAAAGKVSLVGLLSLTATPRKTNATVLSVPSITTTHNKEAKFFSGSKRPVISSFTSGAAGSGSTNNNQLGAYTNSVQYLEIGITLTVKPLIGNDNSVQLETKLNVSDSDRAQDVEIGGNQQPVVNTREANSFNTIKSGEIIVLGGLQYTKSSHSTSRLGPIPWIGDLLGKRTRGKDRTELIVFIRPTVLTNTPADNEEAFKRIDTLPDPSGVRQKLDPNYVPPPTPFYKKHIDIP